MIPRKPHHKGFKRPTSNKPWTSRMSSAERRGDTQETIPQRRGLRSRGTSTRSKTRQQWQSRMTAEYAHERSCTWPGCMDLLGLAHAHRLKKRLILTEEEYVHGQVKLCVRHHHFVEYGDLKHRGTHRRMFRLITALMKSLNRPTTQTQSPF